MYSESAEDILNRMLGNVPSDVSKSEGSFTHDSLAPISEELAQNGVHLDEVLNKVFAISAAENGYSDELEQKCAEFGIYRKDGTKASGQVAFTGTEDAIIPIGTIIQTSGQLQYVTTEDVILTNGTALSDIEASEVGNLYNVPSDTIIELPVQVVGITSVTNYEIITGGTEIESDADLVGRLLLKVRTPATSGNVNHYKLWATEIPGIGDAKIVPIWNGPGTVKVCLIDSNKQPVNANLVEDVMANIENNRPIGATVTVISATPLPVNISANFSIEEGFSDEQIITGVKEKLTEYLASIAFVRDYVSYAYIGSLLFDVGGILDYTDLKINNSSTNINIGSEEVTITGEVVISVT